MPQRNFNRESWKKRNSGKNGLRITVALRASAVEEKLSKVRNGSDRSVIVLIFLISWERSGSISIWLPASETLSFFPPKKTNGKIEQTSGWLHLQLIHARLEWHFSFLITSKFCTKIILVRVNIFSKWHRSFIWKNILHLSTKYFNVNFRGKVNIINYSRNYEVHLCKN